MFRNGLFLIYFVLWELIFILLTPPLHRICFAVACIFADVSRTGGLRKGIRRIFDNPSPRRPFKPKVCCSHKIPQFFRQRLMALKEENNSWNSSLFSFQGTNGKTCVLPIWNCFAISAWRITTWQHRSLTHSPRLTYLKLLRNFRLAYHYVTASFSHA